jgi:3-oxoacyl-[acyl-carrier protein] reductase
MAPKASAKRVAAPRKRDAEVIAAATKVFYERGYSAATVQDVADELGILKGSVYHYIKTKEDLLFRLLEEVHEDVAEILEQVVAEEGPDPLQRLGRYVAKQVEYNLENLARISVYYHDFDRLGDEGRKQVLAACPEPDIIVNNAGGPPPGDFRDWTREHWIKAVDANMLTPIEFIKATVDGMMKRGFGRIVNITSSSVKAPIDILGLSNGARSGLTGFVAGVARVTVKHGVTINGLLPGPFDTDRLRGTIRARASKSGRSFEEEYKVNAAQNPSGRFGTAEEFGVACAFLCSVHAGYITGQNLLMDGGQYPGTY